MDISRLPDNELFTVGRSCRKPPFPLERLRIPSATIMLCSQGSARLEVDFIVYDIVPHVQLILLPGTYMRCVHVSEDFTYSYITFAPAIYDEVTSRLGPSFSHFLKEYPHVRLPAEKMWPLVNLMQMMGELYSDRNHCFRQEIFKNNVQSFLMNVYDKTRSRFGFQSSQKAGRQEALFLSFVHLVFEHGATQRDVGFYAEKLCVTPRYLSSVILHVTGENTKSLIDKHAVQEIKMMLKSTDCSIQEIAARLDFPDQSLMARYFKKHTGMSPMEYRYS